MTKLLHCAAMLLLAALFFSCRHVENKNNGGPKERITYMILQLPGGWGYSIYNDGKLFIRQETIPAIRGSLSFACERDAAAVAKEVAKKLNLGESPRITIEELQRLNVKY